MGSNLSCGSLGMPFSIAASIISTVSISILPFSPQVEDYKLL